MIKIIISRGRADQITTHDLLIDYILVCPVSEKESYSKIIDSEKIKTIPDEIIGLSKVRNWCLDNFDSDILMLDDDILNFYYMNSDKARKIATPLVIEAILENLYINAVDSGAKLFGVNQSNDARKYQPEHPFKLCGWLGTIVGVIGRGFRWDERLKVRTDVDYSLQVLSENRFVWMDNRYSYSAKKDSNTGGSTIVRTSKQINIDKRYVKRKWGSNVKFGKGKNMDNVKLDLKLNNNSIFSSL